MTYVPRQIPTKVANPEMQRYLEQELIDIARIVNTVEAAATGVGELVDLSDVSSSTPTNRNALLANGSAWVSRPIVEADISDLGSYALASHTHVTADITDIPAYNVFTGGAIVTRHSSGYIFTNYLNMTANYTTAAPTGIAVETTSDKYVRWQTPANLFAKIGPMYAEELSSSVNLNSLDTLAEAGHYYQTANADTTGNNYPNGQAGSLLVQPSAGGCTQLYQTYVESGTKLFFRSHYTTDYGAWHEVITDKVTQTISATKTFSSNPQRSSQGGYLHHNSGSYTDAGVTFSTSAPSGGTTGDIWFRYS